MTLRCLEQNTPQKRLEMKNNIINFQTKGTIIIAEGCDNHFGSLDNAKKMVISAKKPERM